MSLRVNGKGSDQPLGPALHLFLMPSKRQTAAAKRNIKKAVRVAKEKRTVAHLQKKTRTALGKEGAKAAKRARAKRRLR
jgi:hypothetical protein